jgi:hypothetical protein
MLHPYTRHGGETPQHPRTVAAFIISRLRRLRARVQAATKNLTRYMQRMEWQRQGARMQTPWIPTGNDALASGHCNKEPLAQRDANLFIGVY